MSVQSLNNTQCPAQPAGRRRASMAKEALFFFGSCQEGSSIQSDQGILTIGSRKGGPGEYIDVVVIHGNKIRTGGDRYRSSCIDPGAEQANKAI